MSEENPRFDDEFGSTYVLISPGTYQMGNPTNNSPKRELPSHEIEITNLSFSEKCRLLKSSGSR